MKRPALLNQVLSALFCAVVTAMPVVTSAQSIAAGTAAPKAPDAEGAVHEYEFRARVVELDTASRVAVLRGADGQVVTVDVPSDVKNFDQVRLGDDLVVRYIMAIAVRMEPAATRGIRERVESGVSVVAVPGGLPATGRGRTVEVLALVESLDKKARIARLKGTRRTISVAVPTSIDVSRIKEGDQVRAVFAEAALISVERATSK